MKWQHGKLGNMQYFLFQNCKVVKKIVVMKLQHEKLVNMQYFLFQNCKVCCHEIVIRETSEHAIFSFPNL